jgi:hypothetical protein
LFINKKAVAANDDTADLISSPLRIEDMKVQVKPQKMSGFFDVDII